VWFRAMYMRMAIQCPSYECARQQLKQRGARHCTAEERQLLLTLPGLHRCAIMPTTLVVGISAAYHWLRANGERQAADELSQHHRPVLAPAPAAARNRAAQRGRTGLTAAKQRAACIAGVDLHELLPADSNARQVVPVARGTRANAAIPAGLYLDTAALTTAGGAVCRVPILRPAGSRAGLVWAKALYKGLEMERRQPWYVAVQDLKQLGGRICSVAERRVLETFVSVYEDVMDTALIRVDAACQWLLRSGQQAAAAQLADQDRQLAAAHCSAAGDLPAPDGLTSDMEQSASAADSGDQSGPSCSDMHPSDDPAGQAAAQNQSGTSPAMVRAFAQLMPLQARHFMSCFKASAAPSSTLLQQCRNPCERPMSALCVGKARCHLSLGSLWLLTCCVHFAVIHALLLSHSQRRLLRITSGSSAALTRFSIAPLQAANSQPDHAKADDASAPISCDAGDSDSIPLGELAGVSTPASDAAMTTRSAGPARKRKVCTCS